MHQGQALVGYSSDAPASSLCTVLTSYYQRPIPAIMVSSRRNLSR